MVEQQHQDQDGFSVQNQEGLAQEFLKPGTDFKEKIARGGLSMEDAMDYGELWRVGVSYRVAILIEHADHAVTASIGQDRLARHEAANAVTGGRQYAAEIQAKKRGIVPWGRKGGTAEESPQVADAKMVG